MLPGCIWFGIFNKNIRPSFERFLHSRENRRGETININHFSENLPRMASGNGGDKLHIGSIKYSSGKF